MLGANDGIISTASLIVGVAAAVATQNDVLIAGVAGLVAGAMSMAAGEYVSVSSQSDTEQADLARERKELSENAEFELDEPRTLYRAFQVTGDSYAAEWAAGAWRKAGISYFKSELPKSQIYQFRVGDAQALPYPDRSFDVAIMALVISFVPDPAKAVAEMVRVVRPSGWVATYMWDVAANRAPHSPCYATMSALGFPVASRPSNASELNIMRSLWEQTGMKSVETRTFEIPVAYSDFDDFWDSNTALAGPVGKAIEKLSPADRERVRSHLREHLPQDGSGRISYQARANAVKGIVPG